MVQGMRVGQRVGRVRRVGVVVGRVSQRWMVVPLSSSSSVASYCCARSFCSLPGQTGLVCGGPVGLGDDDVWVLEEGSGAQAVVVHGLSVGLQVALHVLGIEGEVRAYHGGKGGGRSVGEMRCRGHGEGWG